MGSSEVVGNRGQEEEEEEVGNATGLPNRLFYSASSIPGRLTFKFAGGGEGGGGGRQEETARVFATTLFSSLFPYFYFRLFSPSPLSNGGCQEWEQMEREKKEGGGGLFVMALLLPCNEGGLACFCFSPSHFRDPVLKSLPP